MESNPVTIVAPDASAMSKTEALRALGATVVRLPFADWWQVLTTRRFEGAEGVFFHPVAETAVVAGNATIGSVMRRERPGVRMIAAEAETALPAAAALAAGGPVTVAHRPSFVDGIGSSTVLAEMWPLVRGTVDAAVSASLAEIAAAIRLLALRHRVIAEGAGAASVAAALAGRAGEGDIVCIVSGGNLDASKLGPILGGEVP